MNRNMVLLNSNSISSDYNSKIKRLLDILIKEFKRENDIKLGIIFITLEDFNKFYAKNKEILYQIVIQIIANRNNTRKINSEK